MAYVYVITNIINGKKYIGSSRKSQIDENYYGSGRAIKDALKKYGKNNFTRDIIWQGEGNAREIESQWLEHFDAATNPIFYNLTNDARGNDLHKEETKLTVSEKLTGRKFTKEICDKISKAKKGSTTSKKGKPDGPKPGVSKAHKGRTSPNKGKGKSVALYNINGEFIQQYDSYYDLSLDLNIHHETIRCHLIGKANTICNKQYKVKYVLGDE
jgi:group I intron endonuclease